MKRKRVVIAMSGGVDSSVAAAILQEQGYEVIGLTMCFNLAEKDGKKPSCCGLIGIEDARRVAQKLGIRHYVVNLNKDFSREVIHNFYQEYLSGRTPNPCVRCNQFIKFGILLNKAINLGAQFLATGHYARIVKSRQGYLLKKARDLKKDQSYFLYRLNQGQLKQIIFPLGNYNKSQVRSMASDFKLNVAEKQDSQEICFLPDGKYGDLIKAKGSQLVKPGYLVDKNGNILGRHKGIPFYTIGQRQGLGIAKGYPLYVTQINARNNQVTVGRREDACKNEFLVKDIHFLIKPFKKKVEINVKIRYNHNASLAVAYLVQGKLKVYFKQPQFAITPGQSAVFYQRDTVLGGGIIEKVLG
ncbi:MAG: tRNA 2-thiouridine(34) synthase MnmA [Candidatus Omnitrophica bacterium]|nr:tRNA 2-thiouridine(34) synthase MnmA [Candidatus Omnitrophota bacterium]MBU1923131.1 tRNA 2-thiouridine(34) synthase MnmA [Candidatus Omnitrophota bacterium]